MANVDIQALKNRIDYRSYYEQHVQFVTRHGDWWEGHCPFHEDKTPSFGANTRTGQWKCHSCGEGGDVLEFEMKVRNCDFKTAVANLGGGNVIPFRPASGSRPAPARAEEKKETPKTIDSAVAERYHLSLLTDERAKTALDFLHRIRGYTDETIERYKLGFEPSCWKDKKPRVTFPVFDEDGWLVNIRMYRRISDEEAAQGNAKMLPWQQGYGATRWYPIEAFQQDEIVICEGEPDTLLCRQLGFNAVTQTGGAKTFLAQWATLFRGKRVRVCYDHDTAGHEGAQKVAEAIASTAAEVRIIELPVLGDKEDFTDWVLRYDGNPEGFRELIEQAPVYRLSEGGHEAPPVGGGDIPLEQQIRELPPDLDFDEKQAALRRWIEEAARKRPFEQDRLIDMMASKLNLKKTTLRREVKAAEAALKLEAPIPTPLAEPRQDDMVLAQDYHKGLFHYGVWLPTNKEEWVFRMATSQRTLQEAPRDKDLPRDGRRWSVDSRTPHNIFAYLAGETHVDPGELFAELESFIRRYVWYPDERVYPLLAAWVMQTYVFMLFDQCGYLALVGTKGAGKSLLFEILAGLCFNAQMTAVPSDAYVFRSVDTDRVTLLIDEADALKVQPKEQVNNQLEILRGGYRRSGTVGRIEGEDRRRVEFSVYSPKAVANVSGLEDALEDRTIPIPVVRKPANVIMQKHTFRRLRHEYQLIRNKLYCWGLEYAEQIAEIYDQIEIRGEIRDREADIWSGVIAIVRLARPEMEDQLIAMARENSARKALHEGSESVEGQEVLSLWAMVNQEEPSVVDGAKKWFAASRVLEAVKEQLGWDNFSYNRMANDLVKMRVLDDSPDYKSRFWSTYESTDKAGRTKVRKRKIMCYWIRKDRLIAAAERYSVQLEQPQRDQETAASHTPDDEPF